MITSFSIQIILISSLYNKQKKYMLTLKYKHSVFCNTQYIVLSYDYKIFNRGDIVE